MMRIVPRCSTTKKRLSAGRPFHTDRIAQPAHDRRERQAAAAGWGVVFRELPPPQPGSRRTSSKKELTGNNFLDDIT